MEEKRMKKMLACLLAALFLRGASAENGAALFPTYEEERGTLFAMTTAARS